MKLNIKPLSVNDAWEGKRRRSHVYNKYTKDILTLLRPLKIPEGYLQLNLKFGFSSAGSDIDNPLKPFIDCLQLKYKFNDNRIKKLVVETEKVKKGCEYIEFSINNIC